LSTAQIVAAHPCSPHERVKNCETRLFVLDEESTAAQPRNAIAKKATAMTRAAMWIKRES
jgi:hypothetical protein